MSSQPLGDRSNYQRGRLDANDLLPDPVDQFHRWVNEAIAQQVPEPLAAALATADEAGNPSVRMILIRGIGPEGIDFYTNHGSRKGRDLAARPAAALTLWWPTLERQVRLSGLVARLSEAESAAYFASRPRESQLGAWASAQGEPIADRAALEAALSAVAASQAPTPEALPALPTHWGGYRVT
ncbi:MAG: pyridoxal 5'-phosphate synthase, partial [Chloroflexi bacterium]|nr:pyridoxal 5'-phosphate synthase [Chloroflexota bacterium]